MIYSIPSRQDEASGDKGSLPPRINLRNKTAEIKTEAKCFFKKKKNNYHIISLICRIYKMRQMKLFKKQTDSQTWETNVWLPGRVGEGVE